MTRSDPKATKKRPEATKSDQKRPKATKKRPEATRSDQNLKSDQKRPKSGLNVKKVTKSRRCLKKVTQKGHFSARCVIKSDGHFYTRKGAQCGSFQLYLITFFSYLLQFSCPKCGMCQIYFLPLISVWNVRNSTIKLAPVQLQIPQRPPSNPHLSRQG